MPIEQSHGKPCVRPLRADRAPRTVTAEMAAPFKDPSTGRFTAGNPGGRLRQAALIERLEAESLLRLPVASVAAWLKPHLQAAQAYAQGLVDSLPARTSELVALCGDEAKARLLANAALTEGAREGLSHAQAQAWREESRAWMREVRQVVLTRKAIEHRTKPDLTGNGEGDFDKLVAEAAKPRKAPR